MRWPFGQKKPAQPRSTEELVQGMVAEFNRQTQFWGEKVPAIIENGMRIAADPAKK